MSKHEAFIMMPMDIILKDAVLASSGIGNGIETYPLCDYVMQSVFLKMTGFQEQKMKCIAWEIATNDFEYRFKLLNNKENLGECSTYDSKNKIYKTLCKQIKEFNPGFNFQNDTIKSREMAKSTDVVKAIFNNTNLAIGNKKYNVFSKSNFIQKNQFSITKNKEEILFDDSLIDEYKILYKQRNRIAHNTLSYQQNLPDFKELIAEKDSSRNYFLWFSLLLLIDNIFMDIFKSYTEVLNKQPL